MSHQFVIFFYSLHRHLAKLNPDRDSTEEYLPIFMDWLKEQHGPPFYNTHAPSWTWIFRSSVRKHPKEDYLESCWTVMFSDTKDAMLFKLTWL